MIQGCQTIDFQITVIGYQRVQAVATDVIEPTADGQGIGSCTRGEAQIIGTISCIDGHISGNNCCASDFVAQDTDVIIAIACVDV